MNVIDFAAGLPASPSLRLTEEARGFDVQPIEARDFVAPDLNSVITVAAPATLITAPAAAGKSTCARAIAHHASALYADLAGRRVAEGSFLGILDEALGGQGSLDFRESLRKDQACIVLDALDETHVASREAPFVDFLRGIARFLRTSASTSGNLLFLARLDTADYIRDVFNEENVALAEYELAYFDRQKAERFIDLKLDGLYSKKHSAPIHRQHRSLFLETRDRLVSRLSAAVGAGPDAEPWASIEGRRLLGYSPVLDGIATYLCVQDFRELQLGGEPDLSVQFAEWDLLGWLMNELLVRERDKFLGSWPEEIARPMFKSEDQLLRLYQPNEQCERLLALVEGEPQRLASSGTVPPELEKSYEDAVMSQLQNHPFLASSRAFVNAVFGDYCAATVLSEQQTRKFTRAIEQRLRSESLPSPALAPFMMSISRRDSIALRPEILDLFISSMTAREDLAHRYGFRLSLQMGQGSIAILRTDASHTVHSGAVVLVPVEGDQAARLPSACRTIDLEIDGDVEVVGPQLRLGPDLRLRARCITLSGQDVFIDANSPIVLDADLVLADWDQTVDIRGDQIRIYGDEAEGWPYRRIEPRPEVHQDTTVSEFLYAIRRLLRFFRRTQHVGIGTLAADQEEVDTYVLKNDSRARQVVAVLRQRGWFEDVGPSYQLSQDFLASIGLTYSEVEAYRSSPELEAFIQQVDRDR